MYICRVDGNGASKAILFLIRLLYYSIKLFNCNMRKCDAESESSDGCFV